MEEKKCPACQSGNIRNDSIRKDNGIIGPGYKSWIVEEKYSCNDCGVYFKPVTTPDANPEPNEVDDQLTFSIERGDLWKSRALSAEKQLEELRARPGAVWVKASTFKYVPGAAYCAKDNLSKGAGKFDVYGQFIWGDGTVTLPRDFESLLILDESPAAAREEDAVEFAEWVSINNWVLRNDKTTWHWGPIGIPKEEWIVCTSSELYIKFKQQKEK